MRTRRKNSPVRTKRARAKLLQEQTREMNEQLVISGVHQHELTEAAEKLNQQLQTEIAERKRAEAELQVARDALASDLAGTQQLLEIGARLVQQEDLSRLLGEMLDAAITFTHADFGNVQLLDYSSGDLRIVEQRGFGREFLDFFHTVKTGKAACGAAAERLQRLVVEDVESDPIFTGTPAREVLLKAGVLAVQSTPLVSRSGTLLGVLSTHHRSPGRPSERDLARLDLLGRQAADLIEHQIAGRALRRAMQFDEAVLSNIGEGLYTVDAQGFVTSLNPAAEKLFGWRFEEVRGRKMHDLTHYKHRNGSPFPAEECAALKVLQEGRTLTNHEDVFIRKDGTFFDVLYSSSPLWESDKITGLVVVFRDVTERKRANEALRESEERFRTLADAAPVLIWLAGSDKLCTYFNKTWLQFVGRNVEQELGNGWAENVHPDDLECCLTTYEASFDARLAFVMEYRLRHHTGQYRWVTDHGTPRFDSAGTFQGFVGTCADIHDQKEAKEKLEKTVDERTTSLQETVAQLEEFSYSVSHDLRAPLRVMQGYAAAALEDFGESIPAPLKNYLQQIAVSGARMERLTRDVLIYSKVARGEVSFQPIALGPFIQRIIDHYPQFHSQSACVTMQGALFGVVGIDSLLSQVISNILDNAIKFVREGERPNIRIWNERRGQNVRLWIEDNGIGIAPEFHVRIFGMFEQVHPGGRYEGTGIGLAIVRKAVERMGGKVGLESDGKTGTKFWIDLAAAHAEHS